MNRLPDLLPVTVGFMLADFWLAVQHTVLALAVQTVVGLASGNWWIGGLVVCCVWAGREHAQAEARFIAAHVPSRHRADMPAWAGFSPRVWDVDSFAYDLLLPCIACWTLAGAAVLLRF